MSLRRSRALFALAWRESRSARRRLLLYMSSISLGVAALVAIDSFAGNVTDSVHEQSRALLGGDLSLTTRARFTPAADSAIDSLRRRGASVARVTSFASMGAVVRTGNTRLVQVRAVSATYPLYGRVVTQPAGAWRTLPEGRNVLVDPSLLIALDARVGDSLTLGYGRFEITGTLEEVPGDPGIAAIIGPRVFIPERFLPETQLLVFGSRAEYEALLKLPPALSPARAVAPLRPVLERERVRIRTVTESEQSLTDAIKRLSDFLGIVGLIALLLGGIGVASGVNAFVAGKIDTVAVLRCLGATGRQVLVIYTVQAAAMGVVGAAVGAALGVGVQFLVPRVLGDFLPVDVVPTLEPLTVLLGLAVGAWVALVFALRPLVALRNVSPLQAIRRDADDTALRGSWRDLPRVLVLLSLVASVVLMAISRAPDPRRGIFISFAVAVVLAVLSAAAWLLSVAARRLVQARWPFVVRQGVANLYRPANQTRAVVIALGFGAFLVTTIMLVQTNLLGVLDVSAEASRGNLLFFDVQEDQIAGVDSIIAGNGAPEIEKTPIVVMRLSAINGMPVATWAKERHMRPNFWVFQREYRSSYRWIPKASEKIVRGRWFRRPDQRKLMPVLSGLEPTLSEKVGLSTDRNAPRDTLPEVSLSRDIARDAGIRVGYTTTWDVQGVPVTARVTSLREVDWGRFETNFFAVFSPDGLEHAPKSYVVLAHAADRPQIARIQRAVVARFPNASSIDLSLIRETVTKIVSKVSVAIRFLAIFSLAMGIPVLFSAVAATRRQRIREGVLLKTLGATRAQIGRIMLSEYALLGALGALTGMVLAFGGAWGLMHFVFEGEFHPAIAAPLAIAGLMLLQTIAIGVLTGRDVFRETPMAALRES